MKTRVLAKATILWAIFLVPFCVGGCHLHVHVGGTYHTGAQNPVGSMELEWPQPPKENDNVLD